MAFLAFFKTRLGIGVLGLLAVLLIFIAMKIQIGVLNARLDKQIARNAELQMQVAALSDANRKFKDSVAKQNAHIRQLEITARHHAARADTAARTVLVESAATVQRIEQSEITPERMNQWLHELFY